MMYIILFGFITYLVIGRVTTIKKELEEKIEELENSVKFLNDKFNVLKKLVDKQKRTEESGQAKAQTQQQTNSQPCESNKNNAETADKTDISEKVSLPEKPVEPVKTVAAATVPSPEKTEPGIDSHKKSYEWLNANKKADEAWQKISESSEFAKSLNALDTTESPESSESATKTQKKSVTLTASGPAKESPKGHEATSTADSGGSGGNGGPTGPVEGDWGESWRKFKAGVDWEQFTGAMLFAWLGGIALFIGAGFFVKYSIDKNLISPVMRLIIGALVGLGMIGGSCWFERGRYDTMRQTFAAGGIGVLYSVFFAATLYYEYLPKPAGFVSLTVVSAAAFVLALFHRGIAISVLGGIGAYITPLLVTTGQGGLLSLFAYLAVVNIGIYQVVKRLESPALLLFASVGTMFSLACGTFLASPAPEGMAIFIAWSANLALFALFLDLSKTNPLLSTSIRWTGRLLFIVMLLVATFVVFNFSSSAPMAMMAASIAIAVALAYRQPGWHEMVVPYAALTFLVAAFWAITRFNADSSHWAFLSFFVYGLAGGAGPILLIYRNGLSQHFLTWFRVFPVAVAVLTLVALIFTPKMSFLFWPMAVGLQLIGIFVSMIFGAIPQLLIMAIILVLAGIIWLTGGSTLALPLAFYGFILIAGALICLVTFYCLVKAVEWGAALKISPEISKPVKLNPALTEWMAASPIMGIFVLLATAFVMPTPIDPNPGMITMLCFMVIAMTLSRRMNFQNMSVITLFSAAFAQAFWALRPDLATAGEPFTAMIWSALLFIASLVLPFVFLKEFALSKKVWMSWSIFELAQAVFFVYAADHFWAREISGWVPIVLAVLKLPFVAQLVKQLAGKPERNGILACHGGVLLFYISLTPFLLLETGWLGLVLVLESLALLWLNHRVEHNGLRRVASVMAPVGLYLLLSYLPQMKGPDSIIILNPAVLSVVGAVLALFAAAKLAPHPDDNLGKYSISRYFLWLAVGTGFYLTNLVVADIFTGSQVASGPTIRFLPVHGDLLHSLVYMALWAIFGAVLWRKKDLPMGIRIFGLILVGLTFLWLIAFPFNYGYAVAAMSPLLNLAMLAYAPIMLVLLFLFLTEPWGETSISIKNLFLAMLLITGLLAMKVIKATILQPGLPFDLFQAKTAAMAVASAAGWIIYGLAMFLWPKRLDRPFRLAGLVLIALGLLRTVLFPFRFSVDFGMMTPLFNRPTALFVFAIVVLIWLTRRPQDERWPLASVESRPLFATTLALMVFFVLNIEIASYFGETGRAFSLLTHGNLSHQLGYSLGWLMYAIGLLLAGIRWNQDRARQAALALVLITSLKIFLKDLWSLGQLYRVASFIGLAFVMMLVSYLYQRFLTNSGGKANEK